MNFNDINLCFLGVFVHYLFLAISCFIYVLKKNRVSCLFRFENIFFTIFWTKCIHLSTKRMFKDHRSLTCDVGWTSRMIYYAKKRSLICLAVSSGLATVWPMVRGSSKIS